MALYTATYTEANTITFDVEVPDGMPVDEAYEWLMDHWDETVVPHLDTREMTLVENGLDAVQPATDLCQECGREPGLIPSCVHCEQCKDGRALCDDCSYLCDLCGKTCCNRCAHSDQYQVFCPDHRCGNLVCAECAESERTEKRRRI